MKGTLLTISVLVVAILLLFPVYGATSEIKVTLEWKSAKLMKWSEEAWGLATFDVDGDGVKDIIVPVNGNNVSIFSGATHKEIERFRVSNNTFLSYLFNYAFVAQMDKDSDKELVLGAMGLLLGNIFVVDLKTHEVKMHLITMGGCMDVYDVDGDGLDEIITATNHVEIYKLGSNSPIEKSENMSGEATSMTATEINGKNILFVTSVKSEATDTTNIKYYARIYDFSLPNLEMIMNISAGNSNLNTIAVGDVNSDGNDEVVVGGTRITVYSLNGKVLWNSYSFAEQIKNIKIADLLNNGYKYLVVASGDVEIWNMTVRKIVWQSEVLYDVGEYGGLLVTKLSANNTTEIITRAYAYSEGGRVYIYGVSAPTPNQNGNQSNTTANPKNIPSNSITIFIYSGLVAIAASVAVIVILLLKKHRKINKSTQK